MLLECSAATSLSRVYAELGGSDTAPLQCWRAAGRPRRQAARLIPIMSGASSIELGFACYASTTDSSIKTFNSEIAFPLNCRNHSPRLRLPANAGVINSAGDFVAVSSKDRKRAAAEAFLRRQLEDAERAARDAAAERARLATYSEADAQRERDEAAQRALDEAAAAKLARQLAKAERVAAREREAAEAEAAAKQVWRKSRG